ncbi:hypothetical protein H1235_11210 [Pseudoxanthomonas sp. NC8]|nr:hypothetical protein H1235_11210 [Pseudoxanthomonas sp. NC8]
MTRSMDAIRAWLAMALLVLACACAASAPPAPAGQAASPERPVVPLDHLPALRGDYFPLQSRFTDRVHHIYVRLPEGDDASRAQAYPVVYVLDGDSLFPILSADPSVPELRRETARSNRGGNRLWRLRPGDQQAQRRFHRARC